MKTKLGVFDKFTYKIMSAKTYCVFCKKDTENKNPNVFRTINGKIILKSICSVCNNKKSRFISKNEGSGLL